MEITIQQHRNNQGESAPTMNRTYLKSVEEHSNSNSIGLLLNVLTQKRLGYMA